MPIPFPTRILVADDHQIVRRGLKLVMDREADLDGNINPYASGRVVDSSLDDLVDYQLANPKL